MTFVCIKILYRNSQEVGVCSSFHEAELISTDAKHRRVVINVLYCDDNKSDSSVWVSKCPSTIWGNEGQMVGVLLLPVDCAP